MKHIAAKLAAVAAECAYVQKRGENKHFNYRYATAADVLEMVNAALAKHNVAVAPEMDVLQVEAQPNGRERMMTVRMRVTYVDGDSGEAMTTTVIGAGCDPADKLAYKAATGAIKYAHILTFSIATGDDPEADEGTDRNNDAPAAKSKKGSGAQALPPAVAAQHSPAASPVPVPQVVVDDAAQYGESLTVEQAAAILVDHSAIGAEAYAASFAYLGRRCPKGTTAARLKEAAALIKAAHDRVADVLGGKAVA